MLKFTAEQVAAFLGGSVEGDGSVELTTVAKIEEGHAGALAFLSNMRYEEHLYSTKASAVLVSESFKAREAVSATLIRVEDAYVAFSKLLELYVASRPVRVGVSPKASIAEGVAEPEGLFVGDFSVIEKGVVLGEDVKIYAQVYIGEGVKIGRGSVIHAGVKIYEGCVVGENVIIHSGTVIGADGFGFAPQADGSFNKIPQIGNVVIGDDVEIGANCCIDRATMGSTVLKDGVKIDNLVQVAHNVIVGENVALAAQVGISGSTKIGRGVMMGGQVGVAGHITIAENVKIAPQSGVSNSVKKVGDVLLGSPPQSGSAFHKSFAVFKNLPAVQRDLTQAVKDIRMLKEQLLAQ